MQAKHRTKKKSAKSSLVPPEHGTWVAWLPGHGHTPPFAGAGTLLGWLHCTRTPHGRRILSAGCIRPIRLLVGLWPVFQHVAPSADDRTFSMEGACTNQGEGFCTECPAGEKQTHIPSSRDWREGEGAIEGKSQFAFFRFQLFFFVLLLFIFLINARIACQSSKRATCNGRAI